MNDERGTMNEVQKFDDVDALYRATAEYLADAAATAVAARGRFLLVLAGGSTPRGLYQLLAARYAQAIDWPRVHLFWGDERSVPPEHADSNYRLAADSLLGTLPIQTENVHRMRGETPPDAAAARYGAELAAFFGASTPAGLGGEPAFDLVLLGMGDDGHTASLFPGSTALEAEGWATTGRAPPDAPAPERITLTLPALNSARECLFLVAGASKRAALEQVLATASQQPFDSWVLPAARVQPRVGVRWFVA